MNNQYYAGGGYITNDDSNLYEPNLANFSNNDPMQYSQNQDTSLANSNMFDENSASYAHGGKVKKNKSSSPYPMLAEMIRKQGNGEDTILAHINPLEAQILKGLGGSGTINKKTGLPQFGLFKNPAKWLKGSFGGGVGAVIGNMIMPGIGGVIGGALGGAAGSAVRGRKDYLQSGLRGAAMGAMLPSAASLFGSGANAIGANGAGSALTNYGDANAILPSIGLGGSRGGQYASPATTMMSLNGMGGSAPSEMQYMQAPVDNRSFMEKLGDNSKDYLTQPSNLLQLGTTAAQFIGREKAQKPKTPEQIADEERRYRNASRLTPSELEAEEAYNFARQEAARRLKYNSLREKLSEIGSLHRKVNSPEEYAEKGRWLEYYNNPEFTGEPVRMKEGGEVHNNPHNYMIKEIELPYSLVGLLRGDTGGQDDLIDARISPGEYIIDASTVSDFGDGNNEAGAKKLDKFRENIRKHKRGGKISLPPKAKSLEFYLRG
jgi:hypothetical protein